jgi:hypothetical protein
VFACLQSTIQIIVHNFNSSHCSVAAGFFECDVLKKEEEEDDYSFHLQFPIHPSPNYIFFLVRGVDKNECSQ